MSLLFVAGCPGGPSSGNEAGTDETGTDTDTDGGDPCADVDCSGAGTCVESEGVAACECDEGYVAFGLECLMCSSVAGSYDIDVPMVTLSGSRSLNGTPAHFAAGSGLLRLESPSSGDIASFGDFPGTDAFAVEIIPGTYDIVYSSGALIDGIPHNTHAVLEANANLQGGAHDIDIPMVTLSGSRSLNGTPAHLAAGSGLLRLENPDSGDIASFGDFPSTDVFAVEIIAGTYDIVYDAGALIDGIPHNTHAVLEASANLQGGAHDVDIPMVTISGSRTINGQSVIADAGSGILKLINADTGDTASLGGLDSDTYSVEIVPGTYDIVYEVGALIDGIPHNTHAVLEAKVELSGGAHDIDVPMVTLSGSRSLNGTPAHFAAGSGLLRLEDLDAGDTASFGDFPGTDAFAVEIIPGTYDIVYSSGALIDGIPHNTHAVLEANAELLGGAHDIDIPMVTLSGSRSLNGTPAHFAAGSGLLRLENPDSGDIASFGDFPGTDVFSVEIIPGTYDIIYDAGALIDGIPHNTHAVLEANVELQGGPHDIDIPMQTISGTRTINGQAVAMAGSGLIRLIGPDGVDTFRLGEFESASYAIELVPSNYQVVYEAGSLVDGIPHNTRASLECIQMQ